MAQRSGQHNPALGHPQPPGEDQVPASGTYHWQNMDRQLAIAKGNNAEAIFTFGATPSWAIATNITIESVVRSAGTVTVTTFTATCPLLQLRSACDFTEPGNHRRKCGLELQRHFLYNRYADCNQPDLRAGRARIPIPPPPEPSVLSAAERTFRRAAQRHL